MDTMRQIRDREHRLREALRLGLCTGADPVRTCLERLAVHDRQAALAPELLAFVRQLVRMLADSSVAEQLCIDPESVLADEARALVARAEGQHHEQP